MYLLMILQYHVPFEPKVKLGKVGNSYRVTVPMDMILDLGWKGIHRG
jgi:SpoVT / AbrB like domain.